LHGANRTKIGRHNSWYEQLLADATGWPRRRHSAHAVAGGLTDRLRDEGG
jgi:hypothetical protein